MIHQGIDEGGLGIGLLLLDYLTSAVSEAELRMLFEVAGDTAGADPRACSARLYGRSSAGLIEVINSGKRNQSAAICGARHPQRDGSSG